MFIFLSNSIMNYYIIIYILQFKLYRFRYFLFTLHALLSFTLHILLSFTLHILLSFTLYILLSLILTMRLKTSHLKFSEPKNCFLLCNWVKFIPVWFWKANDKLNCKRCLEYLNIRTNHWNICSTMIRKHVNSSTPAFKVYKQKKLLYDKQLCMHY